METTNPQGDQRRQAIETALTSEMERQAQTGASRIDVAALADAVESALAPTGNAAEGKRPSELNATNDD